MSRRLTRAEPSPLLEIVCDFDGTISRPDTVDLILAALADPRWRELEESWRRREIDSRECMTRQIPLIRGGWEELASFLDRHVELHPSFAPFAAWCRARGVRLRIASEGLDRVIRHLLARERIVVNSVWASRLRSLPEGGFALDFSHASGRTHCGAALCKCEVFTRSPGRPLRILVGDGRSDFCAASRADLVFARAALLEHCRASGIACIPFEGFDEVRRALESAPGGETARDAGEPRELLSGDGR
jgi:2-hydroxy-3-keto-5-methylthiopentenyl-1-phosphate phosphatase